MTESVVNSQSSLRPFMVAWPGRDVHVPPLRWEPLSSADLHEDSVSFVVQRSATGTASALSSILTSGDPLTDGDDAAAISSVSSSDESVSGDSVTDYV